MSNNNDFLNEFANLMAKNVEKSPIMSRYLAEHISNDKQLLERTVANIDPDVVAKHIAQYLVRSQDYNMHARTTMADIEKRAKQIAAERIADEIMQI